VQRWEWIYGSVALGTIVSLLFQSQIPWLFVVFKPAIMAVLILFFLIKSNRPFRELFLYALVLSWFGDIFLLKGDESAYFMMGLGAFLVAHLLYIISFVKSYGKAKWTTIRRMIIPLPAIYGMIYLYYAWPHLLAFRLPVTVYVVAITVMLYAAFFRFKNTSTKGRQLVLIGAISFIVSDSILAYDTFINSLSSGHYAVMISYMFAQYGIFKGYLRDQAYY
jgi:uncharacterized membrane protein YhhN